VVPENINFGIKSSVVRTVLEGLGINLRHPNATEVSRSELGKVITEGTYYLSCWMTVAQIEMMRSSKVIFRTVD
jgi:hypothetical protein